MIRLRSSKFPPLIDRVGHGFLRCHSSSLQSHRCKAPNRWVVIQQKRFISTHQLQLRTLEINKELREAENDESSNSDVTGKSRLLLELRSQSLKKPFLNSKSKIRKKKKKRQSVRTRKAPTTPHLSFNPFSDFPSCDCFLTQMNASARGSIKDSALWSEYGRQVMKMLPYFTTVELASVLAIYAKIGYRDPFVLQGIFEAFYWMTHLRKVQPHTMAAVMEAATELKFCPNERHLNQILKGLKGTSFPMYGVDVVRIQRLMTLAKVDLKNELMKTMNGRKYLDDNLASNDGADHLYRESRLNRGDYRGRNAANSEMFVRDSARHPLPSTLLFPTSSCLTAKQIRDGLIPGIIKSLGGLTDGATSVKALEVLELEGYLTP